MTKFCFQFRVGFFLVCTLMLFVENAFADARTDYLINMLENGGNYRIRVQAATTLGKLRSAEAVPALVKSLYDEHELVVISAATALGQIGDTTVIPAIETAHTKTPSQAAKSQIEITLRILRSLSSGGSVVSEADSRPRFLVRVDAMGDSSGAMRKDIPETLRKTVEARTEKEPGVIMQQPGMTGAQVKSTLKKEKLAGYILSGALLKMEKVDDQLIVKISLNVFKNPDYSLLMMPTAEGAVSAKTMTSSNEKDIQDNALKVVTDRLIQSIFSKLRQMEEP
jgi:hypothetical protein